MNATKTNGSRSSWALRFSVALYGRLLVMYPRSFRREYGTQMLQVFRDCSREAARTRGPVGLCRYWLVATSDLIVSTLAERRQEEMHMTRSRWISLGSLSAALGGGIAVLFATIQILMSIAQLLDEQSGIGLALFPAHLAFWAAPALWMLYILALVGLQAHGADQMRILGWVGITFAILGGVIAGLGNGVTSTVLYSQANSCVSLLDCNFYDPGGYMMMGYMVGLLGSALFAIGMVLYGIVALRRRFLAWGNWIPLVLGLTPLLLIAASVIAALASGGTDYAGSQKIAIVLDTAALVPAIFWVLLGLAMRGNGHGQVM
ncbi:MAG TPA: hypothetical protein VFN11_18840, partial [Ktedonobacterales bacterium]|nr:hypothetical protein [Ktedonobacterales bacterium]